MNATIHIEDLSETKKKITFEVPENRIQDLIDSEYRDLKKNVQIKGFRKGKVPLSILRSYFKSKVEADAARKIIEETFQPTLDEKKITPVSVISIDSQAIEMGKPFKFTAEIEVPPKIEVQGYKGLKLKKYIRELKEEQVTERLNNLRERNARLVPIPESRGAAKGDHIVIDVKAEVEGSAVRSLTVTDYHLELGRDFYLPGFDEKLEGMKIDEARKLTFDLPADFPRKDLAGKTATFEVILKEAKERVLPELDDDFAKDVGEFEDLDALKESIRQDIREALEARSQKEIENQIIDALLEKNAFDVPDSMVEHQIDNLLSQSLRGLIAHGIDPKRIPAPTAEQRDQMRPSAVRTVKAELLLKAISEKEGIEVSDEELDTAIAKRAEQLGLSADYLKDQLEQEKMLEDFRASLVQDKCYEFIKSNAELIEELPPEESEA